MLTKIYAHENLYSRKLMFAKYNVLKVVKNRFKKERSWSGKQINGWRVMLFLHGRL